MGDPVETALLLTVPAADSVVGPHRSRLDRAARVGVPAHVTVLYPFVPHAAFLPPAPADPVLCFVEAVVAAFPDHPPYGGTHDEVVPHLTVGHNAPVEQLRVAQDAVRRRLPGWRQVASFALG